LKIGTWQYIRICDAHPAEPHQSMQVPNKGGYEINKPVWHFWFDSWSQDSAWTHAG
jgi:hypothetical protein